MFYIIEVFDKLWSRHPALLYGLTMMLGLSFAITGASNLLIPISLLFVQLALSTFYSQTAGKFILSFFLLSASYFYASWNFKTSELPPEGIYGTALIDISSISSKKTFFGKKWVYKGSILAFTPDIFQGKNFSISHVPYIINLPQNNKIHRPPASQSYLLKGQLKYSESGVYIINVDKEISWKPLKYSWGLAELRYHSKQAVAEYIQSHYKNKESASFLTGITTGEFDDLNMLFEFSRFGLQHIMAISGFHFAILAIIFSSALNLLFTKQRASILLISCLTGYFIFLGCTSSIMRAWITAMITLSSYLWEKQSSGLNSLGFSLMIVLIFDPFLCQNLGFQFSFITTAAILIFFPQIDLMMQNLFLKRSLSKAITMNNLNQHGYFILTAFRQFLSMVIAVNLAALPMTLFYFHKFPLMSIIYNLFFPILVTLSILLLTIAIVWGWAFPNLGSILHGINDYFTQFALNYTYHIPQTMDFTWRITHFSSGMLVLYLCCIFILGIICKDYFEQQKASLQDLAFV